VDYILIKKYKNNICLSKWIAVLLSLSILFLFPIISLADVNANISISAVVTDNGQGGGEIIVNGGGGGGGGSASPYVAPTDITFSGIAYPNAKVFLLLNGVSETSVVADSNSYFSIKLSSLVPGVQVFSLVAEDAEGIRSILLTLPISIEDKTSTVISDLFIPPTMSLDKKSYGRGEDVLIHGYSAKNSTVSVYVDSQNETSTTADESGHYNFDLNTDSLLLGNHEIKVSAENIANTKTKISGLSKIASFFLAVNENTKIDNSSDMEAAADVDGDGIVDIKDFSVLAFWYGKPNPPKNVDLNGDGKVDMTDFSILAYYWND
jgi:hypothetical protein